ncbi:PDZ domain-containing protein [Microbacterium sp. NEAU-LLB]|uniref:endopeptidase La n=2 Tax=Microbacterium stercoris TaxID=2820289 RepID=A0A939QK97_9MICO|nr:PDZ domain-containing protein [Microbacterium stercoris]MBO3664327.1 PDZ domain-containing protein [Microbacterium stercoris]
MWSIVAALLVLVALTFLPTAYVIQRPGPVYDTIGTAENADGEELPLIAIKGAETFDDTDGTLDLTTVQIVGNRERTPSWFEIAAAWLDPSRAVVPIDVVFPQGQTTEQREEQNSTLMVDSQSEATAAALTELGHDVGAQVVVAGVASDDAPAAGIIEEGDRILSADGEGIDDASQLREIIQQGDGAPVSIDLERDGTKQTVEVTPVEAQADGETAWLIGITLTTTFDFPFDVTIQLDNVGGPSAGMMFALGIIDVLTPGALNGGENVAGTGTITADGTVGPIGGIRQKLYGARDAGAEWFLAPASNCNEVAGHEPSGLHVFAVETLDDALAALEAITSGDTADLPTCASS